MDDSILTEAVPANGRLTWRDAMRVFERAEDRILEAISEVKTQMKDDRATAAIERDKLWSKWADHEERLKAIEDDDMIAATRKRDVFRVAGSLFGGTRGIITTLAAAFGLILAIIAILNGGGS